MNPETSHGFLKTNVACPAWGISEINKVAQMNRYSSRKGNQVAERLRLRSAELAPISNRPCDAQVSWRRAPGAPSNLCQNCGKTPCF